MAKTRPEVVLYSYFASRPSVEMAECALFGGASGKLVVLSLTSCAFAGYVATFVYRRRRRLDKRPFKIFWLDLLKLGVGQSTALLINVINTDRNEHGSSEFDAVSWYFPTFLNDELIAVPLGVLLWHQGILRLAAIMRSRCSPGSRLLEALQASGRYHPTQGLSDEDASGGSTSVSTESGPGGSGGGGSREIVVGDGLCTSSDRDARAALVTEREPAACGLVGDAVRWAGKRCEVQLLRCGGGCFCGSDGGVPREVRYDWWLVQLLAWMMCVLCSRLLGGLGVPAAAALFHDSSPYFLLARSIHTLDWSCDTKRWVFAGILRIVIDILQLAAVDWFNKFRHGAQRHAQRPHGTVVTVASSANGAFNAGTTSV